MEQNNIPSKYSLERFVVAQDAKLNGYEAALAEMKAGRKRSHWMWYIFPQLRGLGYSETSDYFGIEDLKEAEQYIGHPILGKRLRDITEVLIQMEEHITAREIFGETDSLKFCSCLTLFDQASPTDIFAYALGRFFPQNPDRRTLARCLKWNAEQWKKDFEKAKIARDYHLLRDLRVDVFNDTVAHVTNTNYTLMPDIAVYIDKYERETVLETKVYDREIAQTFSESRNETKIDVVNGDTLVVAKLLLDEGLRPAVLNMASRQVPGGGVRNGAGAQEENLFRRSNLYLSMFQYHTSLAKEYGLFHHIPQAYPLDRNWGGIYTPKACVFRGTEAEGYPLLREPYFLDFVSVPAVNRPELDEQGMIVPHLVEATKRKIRTIFRIAIENGNYSLVLGAFGCGAFCNPPSHMARIFHEVIDEEEFHNRFTRITFAILDDHNAGRKHNPEGNFLPFAREFSISHNNDQIYIQLCR